MKRKKRVIITENGRERARMEGERKGGGREEKTRKKVGNRKINICGDLAFKV